MLLLTTTTNSSTTSTHSLLLSHRRLLDRGDEVPEDANCLRQDAAADARAARYAVQLVEHRLVRVGALAARLLLEEDGFELVDELELDAGGLDERLGARRDEIADEADRRLQRVLMVELALHLGEEVDGVARDGDDALGLDDDGEAVRERLDGVDLEVGELEIGIGMLKRFLFLLLLILI